MAAAERLASLGVSGRNSAAGIAAAVVAELEEAAPPRPPAASDRHRAVRSRAEFGGAVASGQRGPDLTVSGLDVSSQQLYHLLQAEGGNRHVIDLAVPAGFRKVRQTLIPGAYADGEATDRGSTVRQDIRCERAYRMSYVAVPPAGVPQMMG